MGISRYQSSVFLSTPSVRRATREIYAQGTAEEFLSTPSVRRATWHRFLALTPGLISIHALREEGDRLRLALTSLSSSISIHALREEGDDISLWSCAPLFYFYPRPP